MFLIELEHRLLGDKTVITDMPKNCASLSHLKRLPFSFLRFGIVL